jgi:hypothetical protein
VRRKSVNRNLERYQIIKEFIREVFENDPEVVELLPSTREEVELTNLYADLRNLGNSKADNKPC